MQGEKLGPIGGPDPALCAVPNLSHTSPTPNACSTSFEHPILRSDNNSCSISELHQIVATLPDIYEDASPLEIETRSVVCDPRKIPRCRIRESRRCVWGYGRTAFNRSGSVHEWGSTQRCPTHRHCYANADRQSECDGVLL